MGYTRFRVGLFCLFILLVSCQVEAKGGRGGGGSRGGSSSRGSSSSYRSSSSSSSSSGWSRPSSSSSSSSSYGWTAPKTTYTSPSSSSSYGWTRPAVTPRPSTSSTSWTSPSAATPKPSAGWTVPSGTPRPSTPNAGWTSPSTSTNNNGGWTNRPSNPIPSAPPLSPSSSGWSNTNRGPIVGPAPPVYTYTPAYNPGYNYNPYGGGGYGTHSTTYINNGGGHSTMTRIGDVGVGFLAGSALSHRPRFRTRTYYRGGGWSGESGERTGSYRVVNLATSESHTCSFQKTTQVLGENETAIVSLYEHDDYKGKRLDIQVAPNDCVNLEGTELNNEASSLVPRNESCVMVWENKDCEGKFACYTAGSAGASSLGKNRLNDAVSSIQLCGSGSGKKATVSPSTATPAAPLPTPSLAIQTLEESQPRTCAILRTIKNETENRNDTVSVTIYEHEDFKGNKFEVDLSPNECYNIEDWSWNDQASSIKPSNDSCVQVWAHVNCTGKYECYKEGSAGAHQLNVHGLNDEISSLKLC